MTVTRHGDRLNGEPVTIAASTTRIASWLEDIATVDRIHHYLDAQLRNRTTDPGARSLRAMRLHNDEAQASILTAVRAGVADAGLTATTRAALEREVSEHASRWTHALARLIEHAGWFDHLCDALIATHQVVRVGPAKPCGRCGNDGERVVYTSLYPGVMDRVTVSCDPCGRTAHHPYGEPGPEIDVRLVARAGSAVLEITTVADPRAVAPTAMHVRFASGDVAGGPVKPSPGKHFRLEPGGRATTTTELPDAVGVGARLQVLCVSGFQVSTRSFALPGPAAIPRPRATMSRRRDVRKVAPKRGAATTDPAVAAVSAKA
ncbi:hypothetical protein [Embleya hyalina]|uniref:Uncharacterized protein n=1 Tax=Embleya hyalina TaxID=516124 RepID=A0A401YEA3_9ACTN|nr:hypothetical protein [Embleya hyalina]GCD92898.1 hypothetical protein EHYA_00541 [Embleya hyalina]